MIITLRHLIDRAGHILKTEGLASLLRRGFRFLVGSFFCYRTFYLYETTPKNLLTVNGTDLKPKIDNFTLKIVSTNQEADRLEAEGFEFSLRRYDSKQRLNKGGIAFCFFVGRELAHIGWINMTKQTMNSRLKVDFSNNEVCGGRASTNPKYRRMGFGQYSSLKRRQFAFSKGKTVYRSYINKWNIASQGSTDKFASKYGEGRYLKIMWWKFWKEKHFRR